MRTLLGHTHGMAAVQAEAVVYQCIGWHYEHCKQGSCVSRCATTTEVLILKRKKSESGLHYVPSEKQYRSETLTEMLLTAEFTP